MTDADGDGVEAAADCDDADATLGATAEDADCDGVLTADDCDDADATSTAIADDADCDGVLTAVDCDDNDALLGDINYDPDCDGFIEWDSNLDNADLQFIGGTAQEKAGISVSSVGYDGDGLMTC